MTTSTDTGATNADLLEQVTQIVSAYVSHNSISRMELSVLITNTHNALRSLSGDQAADVAAELKPAVPIKKSITPDFIVCLDDGKKFKTIKRHLSQLGMTPDEYRTKWGLPADYPMVAPNYSTKRSSLAKTNGLGRKRATDPMMSAKTIEKAKADV